MIDLPLIVKIPNKEKTHNQLWQKIGWSIWEMTSISQIHTLKCNNPEVLISLSKVQETGEK